MAWMRGRPLGVDRLHRLPSINHILRRRLCNGPPAFYIKCSVPAVSPWTWTRNSNNNNIRNVCNNKLSNSFTRNHNPVVVPSNNTSNNIRSHFRRRKLAPAFCSNNSSSSR